ncbi:MAG: LacI family transcriptional regulator [Opitutaceae bacterium]|jgi:LacI family transcriptional regulator|nr:LacI family transcriptional regulator [Opitutaceae bacterium]
MKTAAKKTKATQAEVKCPTMQDVADACGYSRATVSLALRGARLIPDSTRRKVEEVANRLGYRTNPMVASLMSLHRRRRSVAGLRTTIAYLNPIPPGHTGRSYGPYRRMFEGARERAQEVDCQLEEFHLVAPGMTPNRMRNILRARGIHGIIVGPLPGATVTLDFDFSDFVAVGLGMSLVSPLIERVANDHFQSAALAVRKCVELGYRRIGFAIGRDTSGRLEHRWLGGFRSEMDQHPELAVIPPLLPDFSEEVPAALPAWLKKHRPDVVVLGNVEAAAQAALPADVGMVLVGVDSEQGPQTGIFQNFTLLGRSVAERVFTLLHNNSFGALQQPVVHLVGGVWVPGTTAPGPGKKRLA